MTAVQKQAWFNLAVVAVTMIAFLCLLPVLGMKAQGAFGLLGLLAAGVLFFRKRGGQVVTDERDQWIVRRSAIVAYSILWIVFVLACVVVPFFYGYDGAVPVSVIVTACWVAFMLLYLIASISILIHYRRG